MACSNLDCSWGIRTNVCVRLDCRTSPSSRLYHGRRPLFPYLKGLGADRGRDCSAVLGLTGSRPLSMIHPTSESHVRRIPRWFGENRTTAFGVLQPADIDPLSVVVFIVNPLPL